MAIAPQTIGIQKSLKTVQARATIAIQANTLM
jgi:hypothetical protein